MEAYETEYCDIHLTLNKYELYEYINRQTDYYQRIEIAESHRHLIIFAKNEKEIIRLNFRKFSGAIRLIGEYRVFEDGMNTLLKGLITSSSGNAVVKRRTEHGLEVKRIFMGRLSETALINGARKIVSIENNPSTKEKEQPLLIDTHESENNIILTQIEIDLLLDALSVAQSKNQKETIDEIKEQLEKKRKAMIRLEIW